MQKDLCIFEFYKFRFPCFEYIVCILCVILFALLQNCAHDLAKQAHKLEK